MINDSYKLKRIKKGSGRAAAVLLCIVMLFSSAVPALNLYAGAMNFTKEDLPEPSAEIVSCDKSFSMTQGSSGKSGKADNEYILSVSTGAVAGRRITCFIINYTSTDGKQYLQTVFPDNAKLFGYNKSSGIYDATARKKEILAEYLGYYTIQFTGSTVRALASDSSDQLYFRAFAKIDRVSSIDIIGEYHENTTDYSKNEWGCLGLALYSVSSNNGIATIGSISNDFLILFSGKEICKLQTKGSSTSSAYPFQWDKIGKTWIKITPKEETKENYYIQPSGTDYNNLGSGCKFIKIDFADICGSGINYYNNGGTHCEQAANFAAMLKLFSIRYPESLSVTLKYKDTSGASKTVDIPFVHSTFLSLMESVLQNGTDPRDINGLAGMFLQDSSAVVPVFINDFASASFISIKYATNPESCFDDDFGLSAINPLSTIGFLANEDDSVMISGCQIYDGDSNPSFRIKDGVVEYSFDKAPSYYYVSKSYSGYKVSANETASDIKLDKYSEGVRLSPSVPGSTYLIGVKTDDINGAFTTNDIFVSLEYENANKKQITTDFYNIEDLCKNYYGCHMIETISKKATTVITTDSFSNSFSSEYRMSKSQMVYFCVTLENVRSFTGINWKLGKEAANDEWQAAGFEIYSLKSLSKLKYDVTANEKAYSFDKDFSIYGVSSSGELEKLTERIVTHASNKLSKRDFSGTMLISYSDPVLVRPGETKHIDFSDSSIGRKDINWEDYEYYMTYEQSKIDLGFTKNRATYKVSVQVGNDVETDGANGDCGSKNQFYFQLVFSKGKSGYVLANQQLSADGFRTGRKEEFIIRTNREYGDLTAVKIIPENPNDNSDLFDKLKIDTITITKLENSGLNISWTVDVNGWISIDYTDSGAQTSILGQKGRQESELARTFIVTDVGYSVNLLVALTTKSTEGFPASVYAEVEYLDKDDITRKTEVDLVAAMFDYAELSVGKKLTVGKSERAVSDPGFMFRSNHTDRFRLSLNDLKSLLSITVYPYSTKKGHLDIGRISVYTISDEGTLVLNREQEYELTSEKKELTESTEGDHLINFSANSDTNGHMIEFSDNVLSIDETLGNRSVVIERVPINKDDKFNVYVVMQDRAVNISSYNMIYQLSYYVNSGTYSSGEVVDKSYAVSGKLQADSENKIFYLSNITAPGAVNVTNLKLKAQSADYVGAYVKYAIVEHVRSGVCIDTYYFNFISENAYFDGFEAKPDMLTKNSFNTGKQMVEFMLTDESHEAVLEKGTDDIVVAIKYTALDGKASHVLSSPNEFMSQTETAVVEPGGICKVYFNQPNVKDIVGISFLGQGDIAGNVGVKYAYAVNYDAFAKDNGNILGYYSFGTGLEALKTTQQTMQCTASDTEHGENTLSVSPIEMTIKTCDAQQMLESGTNAKIRMTLSYYDSYNIIRTKVVDDISRYIVSGSSATGDTLTLKLLISRLSSLRSVELTPFDNDALTNLGWSVESVKADYVVDGVKYTATRSANDRATESSPLIINLSEGSLSVTAVSYNAKTKKHYNRVVTPSSDELDVILMNAGEQLTLTPEVAGSTMGYNYTCYRSVNDKFVEVDDCIKENGSAGSFSNLVFTAPESYSEETYLIKITSREFASLTATVEVMVTAAEKPEAEITTEPETTTEAETTTAADTAAESETAAEPENTTESGTFNEPASAPEQETAAEPESLTLPETEPAASSENTP